MVDAIDPLVAAAELVAPVVVAAPEVEPAPSPEPAPAPVAEPAPAAEVQPEPAVDVAPPTLLELVDDKTKDEAKPEDKAAEPVKVEDKPVVEAKKPDEVVPEVKPVEPAVEPVKVEPVDYFADVKIPETIKFDDDQRGKVSAAFDLLRTDHTAGAQALIDLHNEAITNLAEQTRQNQWKTFNQTRQAWAAQVKADPVLGGNGHETAMGRVAEMRDMFVSDAAPGTPKYVADMKEFNQMLRMTGVGDHPLFLRMMHNISRKFGAPGPGPTEIKPPPNNGKPPKQSRREALYGSTGS